MSLIAVRFPSHAVRTGHAGLDLETSARRYRDALEEALRSALPAHAIEVAVDEAAPALVVAIGADVAPTEARALEREVLDHAWVVRQMGSWAVVS